jgi:hypothetical protein
MLSSKHTQAEPSQIAVVDAVQVVLPQFDLQHLVRLTDEAGLIQHATFCVPNRAEGYSIDDNARALILANSLAEPHWRSVGVPACPADFAYRYLAFLQHAFNPDNSRFRNFLGYDRRWLETEGSEDSHGRSLWALGSLIFSGKEAGLTGAARLLFHSSYSTALGFGSPRACAYSLLGIHDYLKVNPDDYAAKRLQEILAHRLLDAYRATKGKDWKWFEDSVAYGNARLSQSMLAVGASTGDDAMLAVGLESLQWLMSLQRCPDRGHFVPIGSEGFYNRGGEKARFDQQPVEAAGAVSACLLAHRLTGDKHWYDDAVTAFNWFLGANDLQISLYDSESGGCRDGLHPDRVNENQGAESTLSFLMAWLDMRAALNTPPEDDRL